MTKLTHLDEDGCVNIVDVGSKDATLRCAVATGSVRCQSATLQFPKQRRAPKGAVIATAVIAGIMAAKRTHALIRLDATSGEKSGGGTAGEPAR